MSTSLPPVVPTPIATPNPTPVPAPAPSPTPTPTPATASGKTPTPAKAPADASQALSTLLDEPASRPWYRRTLWWVVLVVLLAAGGGLWWWLASRAAAAAPSYATQVVGRGKLTLTVTANGTLQPTRSINIGSELSGTVREVKVDVNDRITRGQVLVVLDTAKLGDQILRSQAAVSAAGGKLAQSEATVEETGAGLEKLLEVARLSGGKVPSRSELDAGRAARARAVADRRSARAGVDDAKAALSTDRINLSKASIVAPADGVVLTRSVDPGSTVAASLQAVTLLTVAEDLARLRLWVYVDEADVGSVKVDQAATFTVSAYPTRAFPARITRVGFGSTITDNVVTYLTYLDVDNADLSLRPGMTATATITAMQRSDVLLVPNAALRFAPAAAPAAAKKGLASGIMLGPPRASRTAAADRASTALAKQVWVLREGTPVAVPVTPGISDGHMTEITGGALTVGMAVITDQKSAPAK